MWILVDSQTHLKRSAQKSVNIALIKDSYSLFAYIIIQGESRTQAEKKDKEVESPAIRASAMLAEARIIC